MATRASVEAATFGLGSGIAGIAGVALSQLTNVGPNLGQAYIIDSFMVVVFGASATSGARSSAACRWHRQQDPRAVRRRGARQDFSCSSPSFSSYRAGREDCFRRPDAPRRTPDAEDRCAGCTRAGPCQRRVSHVARCGRDCRTHAQPDGAPSSSLHLSTYMLTLSASTSATRCSRWLSTLSGASVES